MFTRRLGIVLARRAPLYITPRYAMATNTTKKLLDVVSETHDMDDDLGFRVPKPETSDLQPRDFSECDNDILYVMATDGNFGARIERLAREIMRVDGVSWSVARKKVDTEINAANDHYAWLIRAPYFIGVVTGLTASITAVPLVFHKPTAAWFCETFVHEDLPEGGLDSLDSVWKVGNWTWGWMEPYLGTASFVLLGFQFTRIYMQRLHWKPYTEKILSWRADRLAARYPQYNRSIVRDYSKADKFNN